MSNRSNDFIKALHTIKEFCLSINCEDCPLFVEDGLSVCAYKPYLWVEIPSPSDTLVDDAPITPTGERDKECPLEHRPHGECKTCKHYVPYRDQFSYGYRGDGYCKSTITNADGQAYINCHDEWYCANYKKAGEEE